jgi:SAM-dependent methyltransferase
LNVQNPVGRLRPRGRRKGERTLDEPPHHRRPELPRGAPGKVLDAPAGTGILSHHLRDLGWDVMGCDIDEGNFAANGIPFTRADLNRALPFPDASFDIVVSACGLHRLYNPGGAIAEFARVLKPGGTLYVNLYNFASIAKRLRFLFTGSIKKSINECRYVQTTDAPEANVRHPLFLPQLAKHLKDAGFTIESLRAEAKRPIHYLLAPLGWLVVLTTFLRSGRSRRRNRLHLTNSTAIIPGEMVEERIGAGKTSRVSLLRRTRDGERFAWKVPKDDSAASRKLLALLVRRSGEWHRIGVGPGEARIAPDGTTVLQPYVEGRSLRSAFRDTDLLRDPDDALLPPLAETFRRMVTARVSVSGLNSENLVFDGEIWLGIDSGAIREWPTAWRAWAIQRKKIAKHWIRWDGHSRGTVCRFVRRIQRRLGLPRPSLGDRLFLALRG